MHKPKVLYYAVLTLPSNIEHRLNTLRKNIHTPHLAILPPCIPLIRLRSTLNETSLREIALHNTMRIGKPLALFQQEGQIYLQCSISGGGSLCKNFSPWRHNEQAQPLIRTLANQTNQTDGQVANTCNIFVALQIAATGKPDASPQLPHISTASLTLSILTIYPQDSIWWKSMYWNMSTLCRLRGKEAADSL